MDKYYCRQKYLLECPFKSVDVAAINLTDDELNNIQNYTVPFNLFDYYVKYRRKISVSILDENADSYADFSRYVNEVADVDELLLVNDRPKTENPIIEEYSDATLQAYLYLLQKSGVNAVVVNHIS